MQVRTSWIVVSMLAACTTWANAAAQSPMPPTPVLLDTDLGSGIDNAFALSLLLASDEVQLRGLTTVSGDTQVRAMMACRFFTNTGRQRLPVAAGTKPQPERVIDPHGQYRYYYHPDVLFDRTSKPQEGGAVELLFRQLKASGGGMTIVASGPLTNIARLLQEHPESKAWIGKIVFMAGEFQGLQRYENVTADIPAAQQVFASGVPLLVMFGKPNDGLQLSREQLKKVFSPATPLSLQVQALYELWDGGQAPVHAACAVGLAIDPSFATTQGRQLTVDDEGHAKATDGAVNAQVVQTFHHEKFLNWYVERMSNTRAPVDVPVRSIPSGKFPHRVHVAEDFELDLQRFWWMSGKAETENVPPGSTRALRGTLTNDYDAKLGNPKAMYTAVIFNPVPGPPMGQNTRLNFRYYLTGTDTMRVQIYSLTNGYHRQLYVTGLKQNSWQTATVDMTAARRPDGTGGPLSEGERIDDIQFYVDPGTELLIDDILLYDAAAEGETRPFPKHVHFAAGFDTGKHGQHWVGEFELVPDGYFWRAVAAAPKDSSNSITLSLLAERAMGKKTYCTFRYHTSAKQLTTSLDPYFVALDVPTQNQWGQATLDFSLAGRVGDFSTAPPRLREGEKVQSLHFSVEGKEPLLIDDVILYEPGE